MVMPWLRSWPRIVQNSRRDMGSTPVVGSVTGGTGGSVVSPDEVPGVVTGAVVTSGFVVTGEGGVVSSSVVEGVVALTPAMANVPDTPVTVKVT